jgi:hypothetical protein
MTEQKQVRIECICNPDLHIGDGRILLGPVKNGTKTVVPGGVAEVDKDIADMLINDGQAIESKRDVTVFMPE